MAAEVRRRRRRKGPSLRPGLFAKGLRQGFVTLAEIDQALVGETLTPLERWLLFYSLRAARIEIRAIPAERG
jgi:hypothetical protein